MEGSNLVDSTFQFISDKYNSIAEVFCYVFVFPLSFSIGMEAVFTEGSCE